jgi:hypothetical protein
MRQRAHLFVGKQGDYWGTVEAVSGYRCTQRGGGRSAQRCGGVTSVLGRDYFVTRGLDPRVHHFAKKMDCIETQACRVSHR